MPEEVADRGERHHSHDEPGGESMPQVVKMEVGQPGQLAGPLKGVPYIIPPIPLSIVKDPTVRLVWFVAR